MKRCPHCRQLDSDDAIMCKHCMRNFADPVAPRMSTTPKAGTAPKAGTTPKTGTPPSKQGSPVGFLLAMLLIGGVAAAVMFPELREELLSRYYALQEPAADPSVDPAPPPAGEPAVSATQGGAASPPATTQETAVTRPPATQEAAIVSPTTTRQAAVAPSRAEVRRAAEEARRAARGRGAAPEPEPNPVRVVPVAPDQPPVTEPAAMSVPSPTTTRAAQPLRVGGNIKAPTKIRDAKPEYPRAAVAARVQGIVIIEATIGSNGRVDAARVLRSIPLLDEAALDAVKQWRYEPTLMNGVPVPVIMTVTVQFRLS